MNSDNKTTTKNQTNNTQPSSYNPWNLLFPSRTRTESENSGSSTSSQTYQTGPRCGALQRQPSKNEEYLWMISLSARGTKHEPVAFASKDAPADVETLDVATTDEDMASYMIGHKLRAPAQPPARHSTTTRRPRNMAALPLPACLLFLLVVGVLTDPSPGRFPKVYNALITSNQNLEPSKAYPVYQPVLNTFAFPFQPAVFYGDYPLINGIQPVPAAPPKDTAQLPPAAPAPQEPAEDKSPSTERPVASPEPSGNPTPAPPLPPKTHSPIPLNQFGLPPHVLPLGRIDPAYNGFTQVGPFTYTYPNFRFYDPYDPLSFNPYASLPPLYRPLGNVLEQGVPLPPGKEAPSPARPESTASQSPQTPPPEPSDLNVLNYSSKDPAIPNVPPPPLSDIGLKSDEKSE